MLCEMSDASDNDDDLSDYERARLANIRRNRLALQAMMAATNSKLVSQKPKAKPKPKVKRDRPPPKPQEPTRRSKRTRGAEPDYTGEKIDGLQEGMLVTYNADGSVASAEKQSEVDYDALPIEPEQLDDCEFEAYTVLRTWRLARKRELDIEPYKIFQVQEGC